MLSELGFHKIGSEEELKKIVNYTTKNFHANMLGAKADAAHRAMLKAMVKLHKYRMSV